MTVLVVSAWLLLAVLLLAGWKQITSQRAWRIAALVLTLAFSLAHQGLYGTVAEDSFITFRYSLNLAEGNGPVFNPGEQVEGFSNFLWMVLVALPKALFNVDIVSGAVVLGMVCTLGCVLLAYVLTNRIVLAAGHRAPGLGLAAAATTAGASALAAYGPSGMEAPLFTLLILGTCYAVTAGHALVGGLLIALATMTRPDGALLAVAAAIWLIVLAARRWTKWWAPVNYLFGVLVLVVPWTLWRVSYYGYFVPNAVAAKAGGSIGWQLKQGWDYFASFGMAQGSFLVALVVGIAALARVPNRRVWQAEQHRQPNQHSQHHKRGLAHEHAPASASVWLLVVFAVVYLLFVIAVGGDWMPAWRLLAPVPPLIAVAVAAIYGVRHRSPAVPSPRPREQLGSSRVAPVLALALCGVSLLVSTTHPLTLSSMRDWRLKIAQMSEIGSWLGTRLPAGTVIGTYANGALSYNAGLRLVVVDVLGLTDEHIAREGRRREGAGPIGHIASDYQYVVNTRRPAVAVETGSGYARTQQCSVPPAYQQRYQAATFRRSGSTGKWVTVYPRKDTADDVLTALNEDPRFALVDCPD